MTWPARNEGRRQTEVAPDSGSGAASLDLHFSISSSPLPLPPATLKPNKQSAGVVLPALLASLPLWGTRLRQNPAGRKAPLPSSRGTACELHEPADDVRQPDLSRQDRGGQDLTSREPWPVGRQEDSSDSPLPGVMSHRTTFFCWPDPQRATPCRARARVVPPPHRRLPLLPLSARSSRLASGTRRESCFGCRDMTESTPGDNLEQRPR